MPSGTVRARVGKHSWGAAEESPITVGDVEAAVSALAEPDAGFRVRFDRLTPAEKRYLRNG